MSKHTPGPWEVAAEYYSESPLIVNDEKTIAQLEFGGQSRDERKANAHLIASAPELLEACKRMLRIYYNTNVSYRHEHEKAVALYCEQAISKAEGGK